MTSSIPSESTEEGRAAVAADPAEANLRLTALAGVMLLVLFAAEVVTKLLGVRNVLTAHVVIGYLITPPLLVKLGSTGWRMVRYYRGDPDYRRRGTPRTYLRVLGPVIVVLTLTLVASGILTYSGPHPVHDVALNVHKVSFYLWLVAAFAHVVPHFLEAVRRTAAELFGGREPHVRGVAARRVLVLGALALGGILAAVLSGGAGHYLIQFPKPH